MNHIDLTRAGFRICTDRNKTKGQDVIALYQKRIQNPRGQALYTISVWELAVGRMKGASPEAIERAKFSIECVLYRAGQTIRVDLYHEVTMTPATIEEFYADTHQRLGCGLDLHN